VDPNTRTPNPAPATTGFVARNPPSSRAEAVAARFRRRTERFRRRDRYASGLRRIPDFADLTLAEARLVARLLDEVVVDGRRMLTIGTREVEALVVAVPRLASRLRSWPARGLEVTAPGEASCDAAVLLRTTGRLTPTCP